MRTRSRAARPSVRVDRTRRPATVVPDGWSPADRSRGRSGNRTRPMSQLIRFPLTCIGAHFRAPAPGSPVRAPSVAVRSRTTGSSVGGHHVLVGSHRDRSCPRRGRGVAKARTLQAGTPVRRGVAHCGAREVPAPHGWQSGELIAGPVDRFAPWSRGDAASGESSSAPEGDRSRKHSPRHPERSGTPPRREGKARAVRPIIARTGR